MEICANPTDEMQRLIRVIAGPKMAGETDAHIRSRAVRRVNRELSHDRRITDRTAYALWHGEKTDIPSHVMDVARKLAAPAQTLDDKLSEIISASQRLENAEQDRLTHAIEIIRSASLWRLLDRRSGKGSAFAGRDRRRASGASSGVLGAALYPHLNPEP
ncbi:hypothetical protein PSQ19_06155 [Devosia algicola]|uniref:Uncharacterized protein n=1 Tax=Devosia algicola TaxID=3026418 RepID=A0ABY7YQP8_9HYPH|nr:hypothetical protein [Devosia algicola]WDR03651.1 hypothetical protein PSQ19_06155 [Devosia algicola]